MPLLMSFTRRLTGAGRAFGAEAGAAFRAVAALAAAAFGRASAFSSSSSEATASFLASSFFVVMSLHLVDGACAAAPLHALRVLQLGEGVERGLDDVARVGRSEGLRQDVGHSHRLQDGAHGTSR